MGENHGWSDDQKNEEFDMSIGPRYCNRCDFEAADGYELDGHVWSEHDDQDDEQISCRYCTEMFTEVKDLMVHTKVKHAARVSVCRNFENDRCSYGEEKCWFSHNKEEHKPINCGICE